MGRTQAWDPSPLGRVPRGHAVGVRLSCIDDAVQGAIGEDDIARGAESEPKPT